MRSVVLNSYIFPLGQTIRCNAKKNRLAPEHAQRAHYFTMHLFDEIVVRHCNLLEFKVM